jgi:hypothetical protein
MVYRDRLFMARNVSRTQLDDLMWCRYAIYSCIFVAQHKVCQKRKLVGAWASRSGSQANQILDALLRRYARGTQRD